MRIRHNKKRNTAFIFECLVRSATVAILKNNATHKKKIINIIKEHFASSSVLKTDLECYRSLAGRQGLSRSVAQKILQEARIYRTQVQSNELFAAQTRLIANINQELGPTTFASFVPNYKALATISQLFSPKTSPKNRVLLENKIISNMILCAPSRPKEYPIDTTVYNLFVKKFNQKYDDALLAEQKNLLNCYVNSFADNALSLKVFLNEELRRLKNALHKAKSVSEIHQDLKMKEKTDALIERLTSYSQKPIDEDGLLTILRTQAIVKEIYTDGDSS